MGDLEIRFSLTGYQLVKNGEVLELNKAANIDVLLELMMIALGSMQYFHKDLKRILEEKEEKLEKRKRIVDGFDLLRRSGIDPDNLEQD